MRAPATSSAPGCTQVDLRGRRAPGRAQVIDLRGRRAPAAPPRTQVIDLRGRPAPGVALPVLLDVTGRRAQRLQLCGRVVAISFLVWLCSLVVAGLGLLP